MNSPSSSTNAPELWAGIATAAAAAFVFLKKLVSRKSAGDVSITRSEFKTEMEAMRNRIGASHIALAEKIDANHKEVLGAIASQGEKFERRIDQLEANMARMDERTKAL